MPSRMSPCIARSFAMLLASTALGTLPVVAQEVGTAAAVNPLSQGTPPGAGTRVLRIGAPVAYKERIQTNANGSVQLLFIDKTTINIGPNSNLVIDKFVYNPASGTGEMAASLIKGALRFVGGQLSHQGAATVKTPVATIGVRGGIATIAHGQNGTRAINHFGWITVTNACGTVVIRRTGFAVTVPDPTTCPTEPERVGQPEINRYLTLLTSKPGQTGGAVSIPSDALIRQFGIGQLPGIFGPETQPIQQQTTNVETVIFRRFKSEVQQGSIDGMAE
jgi:hypothetical protein